MNAVNSSDKVTSRCLWISDLEDIFSENGKKTVKYIRDICQCEECKNMRMDESMTKDFWAGEFGDEYVARNRVDWRKRIPFWKDVIDMTGARSVFELGCNAGWNLSAIQRVDRFVQLNGTDVNDTAIMQARRAGLSLVFDDHYLLGEKNAVDLTFTAGVLIHIGPEEIQQTMQMLSDISSQYVLAVEYEEKKETEVLYRGNTGKLWKRPFGKMYKDLGLKLVKEWDAGDGFDNCTAWLLEKK